MADLNLNQIVTVLKKMFTSNNHFVFWYDAKGDFAENIDDLEEQLGITIIRMGPKEQFKTKLRLLDLQKDDQKALIYSPTPVPPLKFNFLADFLRYSKIYTADASTMLRQELGMSADQQQWVETQQRFFRNKVRKERFQHLYVKGQNPTLTVLAALSNAKEVTLSSVLRAALNSDESVFESFEKYDVCQSFWSFVSKAYGYSQEKPSLRGLMTAIILNTAYDQAQMDLPKSFKDYQLDQVNNAISFLQNSRNMMDSSKNIARIADDVWHFVDAEAQFKRLDMSQLIKIDIFPQVDELIIKWLTDRLLEGDIAAHAGELNLAQVIELRQKLTYHQRYDKLYKIERAALTILSFRLMGQALDMGKLVHAYVNHDYQIDRAYREFVFNLMNVTPDKVPLVEGLRAKIEKSYLNDYLASSIHQWNQVYSPRNIASTDLQRHFYTNYVSNAKRTVVIISDAFRFEAAKELQEKLDVQDKFETDMHWLVTGVPSVTYFGMPALLPNHQLDYVSDKKMTVDDKPCDTLEKRKVILQQKNAASQAGLVSKFLDMNTEQRKAFISGQQTIYLYHNEIDNTGESAKSENQVFDAVEKTIIRLSQVIEFLRNLGIRNILITADHGFIYRWAPIDEADKTDISGFETDKKEQRYAFSQQPIELTGVGYQRLGDILGNDDPRYVNYPTNFNIFKAPGASQNYFHGGSSLQEMLIPVLDVTTSTGKSQAVSAKIHDVTANRRITSKQLLVRIMQDDPISDLNTTARYSIYFVDDQHRKISGVTNFVADIADADPNARIKSIRLTLSELPFVNGKTYQLVLHNDDTGVEYVSDYQMDMVIQGGFGFDI